MRWPFGPPHLTLKPSKNKNKKDKKTQKNTKNTKENNNRNNNIQPQNKTKQTKTKPTPKRKAKTRTTKQPNLPNPKYQEEATPQNPKNWGKTSMFNTLAILPDKKHHDIKAWKRNNQKNHPFATFKNNPLFFINFLFFQHTAFVFEKLCFSENTVFKKHSFSKTQLVKPTFSPMSKNTFFQKKTVSFFGFGQFPLKPLFYCFSWFTLFWAKKKFLAKTDSAHENARFFSLPDTNSVRQFLQKIHFWFFTFLHDHLKKPYFYRVFWHFPVSLFFFFLFLFLQHKKRKNKKCNFLFENLIFDIPKNFAKTLFWHSVTLFVFSQKKNYKNGEKNSEKKKNLDQFLTLDLDQFLTLETPNLGPVFNYTASAYIYI